MQTEKKKITTLADSLALTKDFVYKHRNPYHDKLEGFGDFVLRDDEPEQLKGKWKQTFGNDYPIHLEIGTGYGHFMRQFCQESNQVNFIGLDYRFKRSFQLATKLAKIPHRNFRYLRAKGERIHYIFEQGEVDTIYMFFPDPWPKSKHHKKRLFQVPFLEACHKVLRKGGRLLIKTDHDQYAEWMMEEISKSSNFKMIMKSKDLYNDFPEHFLAGFQTKFEKIFLKQNIKIKAIELEAL